MALEATSAEDARTVVDLRTPAILFGLCLFLTAAATVLVAYSEQQAHEARFAQDVIIARDRIDERMSSYLALLRGAAGLFSRAEPITRHEFRTYVARLQLREHYPGTLGLGYTERFGAISAEEATARARARGWTDVDVWPDEARDEVHAIVLLEPLDARNRAAIGFDMHTEPTRREAMDRARDTGQVALSGKVTLVQEIDAPTQAGFLVYTPVYEGGEVPVTVEDRRAELEGYVYMPLRAGDLFAGIFGNEKLPIGFDLYDGETIDDSTRLFTTGEPIAEGDAALVTRLHIAGRVWTARFERPPTSGLAAFPLALGVALLGLLLSGVVLTVSVAHEEALARELRATTAASASREMLRLSETFVGILGHDLRSPLSAISMGARLLLEQRRGDPFVEHVLSRILASSERMSRMIDQILDLTRARLGGGISVSPRPIDLTTVVRDVVDEVQHGHPEHSIELEAHGDLRGLWDSERLAQVFSNLVGNAVKHAEGAPVRVELSGAAPDRVVATVHNVGVIPPELLPIVFDPFRSGTRKGRSEGLGLGLFITRTIVQAHGGRIDVETTNDRGTTFSVVLPRDARRHEPRAAPLTEERPLERRPAS